MKIKLLRGSKEFDSMYEAREFLKNYLEKHNNAQYLTFLTCQYEDTCGGGDTKGFLESDFLFDEYFENVIRFIISAKTTKNWEIVRYSKL